MRPLRIAGWTAAAGAAMAGYAMAEPYRFRITERRVRVRAGSPAVTVLHVSDTHLAQGKRRLRAFLERLPDRLDRVPDLVLATGDLINEDRAMTDIVSLLNGLEARLGRFFVYGSHDYFESSDVSFGKYFTGETKGRARRRDESPMTDGLEAKGWRNVINRTEVLETDLGRIRISGVDDPYLRWHRTGHIERHTDDDLAIALVHAPDVVSEWILNGYDLVVAGHTHGGQIRIPGVGAVVTNCSLPTKLAKGLERVGHGSLHVSPGLSHGRHTPIRFNCRPEATILHLEPDG